MRLRAPLCTSRPIDFSSIAFRISFRHVSQRQEAHTTQALGLIIQEELGSQLRPDVQPRLDPGSAHSLARGRSLRARAEPQPLLCV